MADEAREMPGESGTGSFATDEDLLEAFAASIEESPDDNQELDLDDMAIGPEDAKLIAEEESKLPKDRSTSKEAKSDLWEEPKDSGKLEGKKKVKMIPHYRLAEKERKLSALEEQLQERDERIQRLNEIALASQVIRNQPAGAKPEQKRPEYSIKPENLLDEDGNVDANKLAASMANFAAGLSKDMRTGMQTEISKVTGKVENMDAVYSIDKFIRQYNVDPESKEGQSCLTTFAAVMGNPNLDMQKKWRAMDEYMNLYSQGIDENIRKKIARVKSQKKTTKEKSQPISPEAKGAALPHKPRRKPETFKEAKEVLTRNLEFFQGLK